MKAEQGHQPDPSPHSSPRCQLREGGGRESASLRRLEEENAMLKARLAYVLRIQEKSEILLGEVRGAQERLRGAVFEFRNEQQSIDKAFIESTQF